MNPSKPSSSVGRKTDDATDTGIAITSIIITKYFLSFLIRYAAYISRIGIMQKIVWTDKLTFPFAGIILWKNDD